jgi:hypothetical protein
MPAMTYGDVWRTVRLYCPSAPTFLAREWVNVAWKQLLAARRWGFMRGDLTVTPLPGDTHLTVPADFASFKVVVDESRQVRISTTHSLDELGCTDPALTAAGPVTALIATTPSTDPATLGRARYLYYPTGSVSTLRAIYHRQGGRLADGDVFPGVLADGGEVLTAGALAQAALWPGTGERPNPYFNATLAQSKAAEFAHGIQMLSLRDDEQYPDDLWDSWDVCDCGLGGGDPRTTDASVLTFY